MKPKQLKFYASVMKGAAELSHAVKRKVGAVAVRDDRIILHGYNGTPPGDSNTCEDVDIKYNAELQCWRTTLVTKNNVEHAERNLVYYAAKKGIALEGATLFVSTAPCIDCARAILSAGFEKVYYLDHYKNTDGLSYLGQNGVASEKLEGN